MHFHAKGGAQPPLTRRGGKHLTFIQDGRRRGANMLDLITKLVRRFRKGRRLQLPPAIMLAGC